MRLFVTLCCLTTLACNGLAPLQTDFSTPQNPTNDSARVELGRRLFHEKALSADGTLSCASCHELAKYGVDGKKTSVGIGGKVLQRNSPSVLNAAGQFTQFWDGRKPDVEAQALGPIFSPDEMGMADEAALISALERAGYADVFRSTFAAEPQPLSARSVGLAIGAFERTLATRAPIDDFLEGKAGALTTAQQRGFDRFNQLGCVNCHAGRLVGGDRYRKLGDEIPWTDERDLGRFEVTKKAADRQVFKVPSLRNVAKTAPYFHDGSVETLPEAVKLMGHHQLGVTLSDGDVSSLVEFLDTLTGHSPQPVP